MLTVGDKLPALTLPVQQGTSALPAGETLDLGQTNGKWKILFYWPKDFTFVCPTEIIGYGELLGDFRDRDAELIGASTDTDFVHHAWRKADERLQLEFPWVADNKKELANALGIAVAEIGQQLAIADDLGRADEGEVLGPEEDDLPLAVGLAEVERLAGRQRAALLDGNGEGGEFVADGEHGRSFSCWWKSHVAVQHLGCWH